MVIGHHVAPSLFPLARLVAAGASNATALITFGLLGDARVLNLQVDKFGAVCAVVVILGRSDWMMLISQSEPWFLAGVALDHWRLIGDYFPDYYCWTLLAASSRRVERNGSRPMGWSLRNTSAICRRY